MGGIICREVTRAEAGLELHFEFLVKQPGAPVTGSGAFGKASDLVTTLLPVRLRFGFVRWKCFLSLHGQTDLGWFTHSFSR